MKTDRRSLILRLFAAFGGAAAVAKAGIMQSSSDEEPVRATTALSLSTVRWSDGSERTIRYDEHGRVIEFIETNPAGGAVHCTYGWVSETSGPCRDV